jgi:hypothetical protein
MLSRHPEAEKEGAMNANQIINMVMRLVMRKVIGAGINKGMGAIGKGGKSKQKRDTNDQ